MTELAKAPHRGASPLSRSPSGIYSLIVMTKKQGEGRESHTLPISRTCVDETPGGTPDRRVVGLAAIVAPATSGPAPSAAAAPAPCVGGALSILAHPDDDLLFFSPHILATSRRVAALETVFVTGRRGGRGCVVLGQPRGRDPCDLRADGRRTRWLDRRRRRRLRRHDLGVHAHGCPARLRRVPASPRRVRWKRQRSVRVGKPREALGRSGSPTITTVDAEQWYTKAEVLEHPRPIHDELPADDGAHPGLERPIPTTSTTTATTGRPPCSRARRARGYTAPAHAPRVRGIPDLELSPERLRR